MARRSTGKRRRLLEELMVEARRSGSLGTLHNRAAATLASINATDWECLDVLDWTGPMTAGELAGRLGITSGAVTGVIDRLEGVGLVRRTPHPHDRRKVVVALAAKNDLTARSSPYRRLAKCFAALERDIDEVNERFADDELTAVVEWLKESNAAIDRSIERMRATSA